MKIEGETVIFMTDKDMYNNERRGDKPYTIRIMTHEGYVSLFSNPLTKIRIVETFATKGASFERHIHSIFRIGEIFGHVLVGIAWIHEEEKEIPEQ